LGWPLQEEFEEHAEKAKTLPENTTNENKLILYGLFKQATVGLVNTSEFFALIIRWFSPD
jgi:diazepam-binding inhibitor (GABA receptor modulating acyl-CoA-binding protein)